MEKEMTGRHSSGKVSWRRVLKNYTGKHRPSLGTRSVKEVADKLSFVGPHPSLRRGNLRLALPRHRKRDWSHNAYHLPAKPSKPVREIFFHTAEEGPFEAPGYVKHTAVPLDVSYHYELSNSGELTTKIPTLGRGDVPRDIHSRYVGKHRKVSLL